MTRHRIVLLLVLGGLAVASARCGGDGGGTPTSPPPSPGIPPASACAAIGAGSAGATAIVNGAACSTGNSAVVLLNFESDRGVRLGACSGTVVAPRAILTAAHCLEGVGRAKIWLGSGPEITAQSFAFYPGYGNGDGSAPDVGVIRMSQDLSPAPIPLLTSRDARLGETAVIAGWGRDQESVPATLRAGTALIAEVGGQYLETQSAPSGSWICAGDSGGPLLLSEGGTWAIAGVISARANSGCITGANYYATLRNPDALAFVLEHAPEARRR